MKILIGLNNKTLGTDKGLKTEGSEIKQQATTTPYPNNFPAEKSLSSCFFVPIILSLPSQLSGS